MQDPQSFDEEQANSSSQDVTSTDVVDSLDISGATSSSITDVTTIQDSPENTGSYAHQKLYEGSLMTVKSSCITISRFFHKYNLGKQVQGNLLSLQQQLLPTPNRLPYSLYRFRQVIDFGQIINKGIIPATTWDIYIYHISMQISRAVSEKQNITYVRMQWRS